MPADAQSPSAIDGLSEAEANARLLKEGFNELPRTDKRTPLRIVLEVLREPMLALLLGGGAIYLLLGDLKEAIILLAFATLSVVITVVQETRTERVLEALRDLTSSRALVIRGSKRLRIAGRDVVRGDIVLLSEGDRVPADAILLEGADLQCDESLLTGESVPVRKRAHEGARRAEIPRPGGEDLAFVFSGALVVRGSAVAEIIATGVRSEIGRIGEALGALEMEPPRLQIQTRRLVRLFALFGGGVSLMVVLLFGLTRGSWLDALLAGIAVGMSMLPEEFPVVLTVFMAMGAWRISQAKVLTRRAAAIETLGSATVLCTDKTGTLTQNRMSVAELRLGGSAIHRPQDSRSLMPAEFHDLAEFALLASARDAIDPMEKAFHELGREHLAKGGKRRSVAWRLKHFYGLRPDLLAMSQIWEEEDGKPFVVATKGAPEAITALCRLSETEAAEVNGAVDEMAAGGLRVLGIARARHAGSEWPKSQRDFDFEFLGLAGLADPLREGVREAVGQCRSAGIRVVMITGDYPATARAIARSAGIDAEHVVSGEEFARMDEAELGQHIASASVFARIMPEQKLRVVNALKASGEIVAMTGDGVNDAPSLKAAHIGIAMGGRGTDVAREASSLVLLDDDFSSIVKAVRLGRRIYDNLRKAMGFIFAVHVPIAGLALLPLLFGLPILFTPVHIAFLEMIIDPVCSLVFEAESEEEDVMARPPRPPNAPLFSSALVFWSLLQGALAFLLVGAIFVIANARGMPEAEMRALAFFSLVMTILGLIFVNRSFSASLGVALKRPNRALLLVILLVVSVLGLTLAWPVASDLFRFGPLHFDDLTLTVAAGAIILILLEAAKPLWRARLRT